MTQFRKKLDVQRANDAIQRNRADIAITYIKSKKVPAASRRDAFLRVRDQPAGAKNS